MAKKVQKGEPIPPDEPVTKEDLRPVEAGSDLAAESVSPSETPNVQPQPATSASRSRKPTLAETAPAFIPQSCPNCGSTGAGVVQSVAADQFQCTRCRHQWGSEAETAPFRCYGRTSH